MVGSLWALGQRRSRLVRWIGAVLLSVGVLLWLAIATLPGIAQVPSPMPTGNKVDGYPVTLNNQVLFSVRDGIPGVVSAEERAQVITQRLEQVAHNPNIRLDQFTVEEVPQESIIMAGDMVLFTIREADAKSLGASRPALAERALTIIRTSVSEYRDDRSLRQIVQGIVLAVLSTIILLAFWKVLQKVSVILLNHIKTLGRSGQLSWQLFNMQILGSKAIQYLLASIVRLLRLILILFSLYLYLPFFLSQFPATRALGNSLLSTIAGQFQATLDQFVGYIPNLIAIAIIAFIAKYVIGFARLLFVELGRDDAYPWFYPEWVKPTTRLASLGIIAAAGVAAAPYLPGFGSPAFQGVSIFLGAIFTLGSSSAVANAIAGIILIYTRAFRLGDIVQIAGMRGMVADKSLFVTRLATFKREVITIPNASVLNGDIRNFSVSQREDKNDYLALYTTITLGYDVPWRKVYDVMIAAAKATPHILSDPSPFVLQTSLNDFHVSYELNAFTDAPELMPVTYSALHENLQDYCNQADIEIMSPGYSALRDGNHSTIPANYLPEDYTAPGFRVDGTNGKS